ncbi:hypothetical protein ABT009_46460 [Streptomyces sp. NPDC002896]|uniref:hypothetical protein n=1 Tax=Streptomyces sp. NPDC002896 TaxID=3154438 RepID=UPI0033207015
MAIITRDLQRTAADAASEAGLEGWLSPVPRDLPPEQLLSHSADYAERAPRGLAGRQRLDSSRSVSAQML